MVSTQELNQLAEQIRNLRYKENEASQIKKAITQELEIAEGEMLRLLGESNLTSYSSPYGRAGISYRTSVKIPKTLEAKERFYQYLREIGKYDLLISVNSQTLNSFYKEQLAIAAEEGVDDFEIPGITEVTINPILSFTAPK